MTTVILHGADIHCFGSKPLLDKDPAFRFEEYKGEVSDTVPKLGENFFFAAGLVGPEDEQVYLMDFERDLKAIKDAAKPGTGNTLKWYVLSSPGAQPTPFYS